MSESALLVVGTQRSGTTLLNRVLHAHSEVNMLYNQSNFLRISPPDYQQTPSQLFKAAREADWSKRDIRSVAGLTNAAEVYREVVRGLSSPKTARYWGEKYAGRCLDALKFLDVTDGKIIHIVRDPRDVCASERRRLLEASGKDDDEGLCLFMVYDWAIGLVVGNHIERVAPDRYLRLRYEDFVADPEGRSRRICAFLGLEFERTMIEGQHYINDDGTAWEGNSSFDTKVSELSVFGCRWPGVLTSDEVLFIESHCRDGMLLLDYDIRPFLTWRRLRRRRALRDMDQQTKRHILRWIDDPAHAPYRSIKYPSIDLASVSAVYQQAKHVVASTVPTRNS